MVEPASINAYTLVSKIENLQTITSGASLSSTAFIAYALAVARASCLPIVCVACLDAIGDAILLLSLLLFCNAETVPPVQGDVKERALGHSFIL